MNDPIISPWLIYLIDTTDSLLKVACPLAIFAVVVSVILFIKAGHTYDEDDEEKMLKRAKMFLLTGILSGLFVIFIPTPHTIYKMMAAHYVTPANIQATGEFADKAVDKVVDKIANAIQKFERSDKK